MIVDTNTQIAFNTGGSLPTVVGWNSGPEWDRAARPAKRIVSRVARSRIQAMYPKMVKSSIPITQF